MCLCVVINVCLADVSLNTNAVPIYSLAFAENDEPELTREHIAFAGQTQYVVPVPALNRQYLPPSNVPDSISNARVMYH